MSKKALFKPKKIAVAVAATLLTSVAVASVIQYAVDMGNLTHDAVNSVTYVYSDTTKTEPSVGYLVVDDKEGIVAPGIGVYTENFSTGGASYQGCIMSSKGEPPVAPGVTTCGGDPDSGKRFKLKSVQLNKPMDIVFNVTSDGATNTYNIYGKFTNDTDVDATGFTVQIGTGIGANFRELPGVAMKGNPAQLGKYPGGLFGGSPAEGLPFFNVESAIFAATAATATSPHTRTTDTMPTQYSALFGDWLPLANVPEGWFYDLDGMPWTDNKLLAYWDGAKWVTYVRTWDGSSITIGTGEKVATVDLNDYPDDVNPLLTPYFDINELTAAINNTPVPGTYTFKAQEVVAALLKILTLTPQDVAQDPTLKLWESTPVTVVEGNALVATWDPAAGDEGLYVVDPDYVGVLGAATLTSEEMQALVMAAASPYSVVPGYSKGAIEDLSNANVYAAVEMGSGVTGPLTMRVFVTDATATIDDPLPPAPPPATDDGGGCTVGGNGRFDPTLPALAAAGLVFFGLRRFKAGK